MDGQVRVPNALWWLQLKLTAPGRLMLMGCGYAVTLVVIVLARSWVDPDGDFGAFVGEGVRILAGIQCLLLIFGACNAIYRAINRDHTSGMLTSHRLSPMSRSTVVIGYGLGGPIQVLVLWGVGLVFGFVLLRVAGLSGVPWLVGNGLLVSTALMLWVLTVFLGLGPDKPAGSVGLLTMGWMMGIPAAMVFPGAGLITGLYAGMASYYAMTGNFTGEPASSAITVSAVLRPQTVSLMVALNGALTWLWFVAAKNRYRRPDRPGFTVPWALVLLAVWLGLAGVGIFGFDKLAPGGLRAQVSRQVQFVASLELSLLLAILPVSLACIDRARGIKGATIRSWTERIPSRLLAVLGPVLICAVWSAIGVDWTNYNDEVVGSALGRETLGPWLNCLLSLTAGLLAVDGYFRIVYLKRARAAGLAAWFLLIVWLGPPGVDYFFGLFGQVDTLTEVWVEPSFLFGCSPVGTLVLAWRVVDGPIVPGLIVQWVLAGAMLVMAGKAERREISRRRDEGLPLPGLRG